MSRARAVPRRWRAGFLRHLVAQAPTLPPRRAQDGVRFLGLVHHRTVLAFPMRTRFVLPLVKPETSRFPCKELHMPGSLTTAGAAGVGAIAPARVHVRVIKHVGLRMRTFRGLMAGLLARLSTFRRHLSQMSRRMTWGSVWVRYDLTEETFTLYFAGFAGALMMFLITRIVGKCSGRSIPQASGMFLKNGNSVLIGDCLPS